MSEQNDTRILTTLADAADAWKRGDTPSRLRAVLLALGAAAQMAGTPGVREALVDEMARGAQGAIDGAGRFLRRHGRRSP